MKNRKIFRLNENELRSIIKEAINNAISENVTNEIGPPVGGNIALLQRGTQAMVNDFKKGNGIGGVSFGIVKGRLNKQRIIQYTDDYLLLSEKMTAIEKELSARSEYVKKYANGVPEEPINPKDVRREMDAQYQNNTTTTAPRSSTAVKAPLQPQYGRALNEGIPLGKIGKGLLKATPKATKIVTGAYLASYPLYKYGIPTKIANDIAKAKDPYGCTASDLVGMFGTLSGWIAGLCDVLKKHPEILGSYAIPKNVQNGPQAPEHSNGAIIRNTISIAASIGLSFAGPVGWIYDAAVFVGDLVSSKSDDDEELLNIVEQQKKYLESAVNYFSNVLVQSKEKSLS